jgi:hypothetical protein
MQGLIYNAELHHAATLRQIFIRDGLIFGQKNTPFRGQSSCTF